MLLLLSTSQVVALLYVTLLVPVRVAFAVDSDLGSGAWWIDLVVDVYFIADLCLNFRTAVWLPNGQLQVDPKEIRRLYLRGKIHDLKLVTSSHLTIRAPCGQDGFLSI
eukprot:COSAG02_NODE_969_length_15565_cov_9.614833_19_plen_108_part_00